MSEGIRRAIEEMGFVQPMPVQEEVIPYLLGNRNDVIALAQTGTGKTAAFGIPVLQRISLPPTPSKERGSREADMQKPQALILAPTRQIADDLRDFAKYMDDIHIEAVYGGASIEQQIRALRKGAQIIVATPGRLIDLMNRGVAKLDNVRNVVLDEADEMLNMGFSESIDAILEGIPEDRNTLLFSATMSKEIERIAKGYLHNPKEIVVGSRNEGAEHVNHIYYMVNAKDKYLALKRIVDFYPRIFAIIFCRTKIETQEVADKLIKDGYNAEAPYRTAVGSYRCRCPWSGRRRPDTRHQLRTARRHRELYAEQGVIPSAQEICKKQLYKVMDQIVKTDVDDEEIGPFMQDIQRYFEFIDKEEIIKKIVSMEFGKFLSYYADAPSLTPVPSPKGEGSKDAKGKREDGHGRKQPTPTSKGYKKLFINLGKRDGFYPGELMQTLNRFVGGRQEVGCQEGHDTANGHPLQGTHRTLQRCRRRRQG